MTVADHIPSPSAPAARAAPPLRQVVLAGLAAIVLSCVAVAVVATAGAALIDAPDEFRPLLPQVYLVFVVLGVALATVAWEVISRTARQPGRVLRLDRKSVV